MRQIPVLTIQDISCVGRCSLTEALPIISAMGLETAILPTAVLSTHTGGFTGYTFRDLTEDMPAIRQHWEKEDIRFQTVYTGYIGSLKQLEYISDIINTLTVDNRLVVVDPVMGDHGSYYAGFSDDFAKAMTTFCSQADVILPNLTEASFMLKEEYVAENHTHEYIERILHKLSALGPKNVVLTGVSFDAEHIGAATYDSATGEIGYYFNQKMEGNYHGTGDIFSSAIAGCMTLGLPLGKATQIAVDYTLESIKLTPKDLQYRYGVNFEKAIPFLIQRLFAQ